jgi:hypothetical protein
MPFSRKQAKTVDRALAHWRAQNLISDAERDRLRTALPVSLFDWHRLAKYAFWAALASIVISVGSVFEDSALLEMLQEIFAWFWRIPHLAKTGVFGLIAAGFYAWGLRRRTAMPDKHYSNGAIMFLGVLTTAFAIGFFGRAYDNGSGHWSLLVLFAAVIYCGLGLWFPSGLIYVFGLLSLGGWFGGESGYMSGWGAYYLGMSWPLRFVFFGGGLVALSYPISQWGLRREFSRPTLGMGMLYTFTALWIMSIFGNYTSYSDWFAQHGKFDLLPWALLFGIAAIAAIWHGLHYDDAMTRGFGVTYLGINLYTRFFEFFWNGLHKAIFFSLLAASLWYIGSNAERIWNLGRSQR